MKTVGAQFVFRGEHAALDFANTLFASHGELEDQLQSWPDLLEWLSQANLDEGPALEVNEEEADAALAAVIALRVAWTKQIEALLAGKPVGRKFLRTLNTALEKEQFSEAVVAGERMTFVMVRADSKLNGVERALAVVARKIANFLTEYDHDRLRRCAAHDCVLFFYDSTKNHRRQWCSAAACGNRHKVAAFRKRQAQRTKN